jgi:hypothetical protein
MLEPGKRAEKEYRPETKYNKTQVMCFAVLWAGWRFSTLFLLDDKKAA